MESSGPLTQVHLYLLFVQMSVISSPVEIVVHATIQPRDIPVPVTMVTLDSIVRVNFKLVSNMCLLYSFQTA